MDRGNQLLKGALDMCLLSLVAESPTYGYEMIRRLEERGLRMVSEGSIYPRLAHFEAQGWVASSKKVSSDGPVRKYYQLTPSGKRHVVGLVSDWQEFANAVELIVKEVR
jgi:PadR family transcriptional regulator PadR